MFSLASAGNLATYIEAEEWKGEVKKMTAAATVVFGFWILLPLLASCALQGLNFIEMLSL